MNYSEILNQNLSGPLGLPRDAVDFLLGVWNLTQVFDDAADGDPINRGELDKAIWFSLVGMTINPFFSAHHMALTPVMATQVLKWQTSDFVERIGLADARSYMWRAGFYDLVLSVVCLCKGPDAAQALGPAILSMYAEPLTDYVGEFANA